MKNNYNDELKTHLILMKKKLAKEEIKLENIKFKIEMLQFSIGVFQGLIKPDDARGGV